jgi:ribosomal protein S10
MPLPGTRLATIQLKGWVKQIVEAVCTDIKKSTDAIELRTSGVIRLPARRERWSILRSPFVHKKSQEQASAARNLL